MFDDTIAKIVALHRDERDLLKAKNALNNQFMAHVRRHASGQKFSLCGGADCFKGEKKTLCKADMALYKAAVDRIKESTKARNPVPLDIASPDRVEQLAVATEFVASHLWQQAQMMSKLRKTRIKEIEKQVALLPISSFVTKVHGFGLHALGQIIAEAGRDFKNFPTVRHLWKRMCLGLVKEKDGGPDVIQTRRTKAELALIHGFSPSRRSVMWSIGDSIIKKVNSVYYDSYLAYKATHVITHPKSTDGHHHKHAHRRMEKDLLRDLYGEWERTMAA